MINEKDIVFITTTLYTKWLNYQKRLIKKLFPESRHIIVDGTKNWPNSWFYWIDEIKKCGEKYYIHIDEDFFLLSKDELLKAVEKIEQGYDLIGCSDGYYHYRHNNPIALNTFLMIGKVSDIKRLNTDLKSLTYRLSQNSSNKYNWINSGNIKYKESYGQDFTYEHKIQGNSSFDVEQEPYYAFMWSMKELGCKFHYLYPHFDDRFKSTNPRINEASPDIGIHMWYTRQWHENFDVWGLPNYQRYEKVEKILLNNKKINIYINVAIVGSVNYVLADLINSIIRSGLYYACNKIYLICNGDFNSIKLNLNIPKVEVIKANDNINKCEFPTLEKIWSDSQNDDITILYLHTKGVTKPGVATIQDWTNYLIYSNIEKWQDRIFELDDNDCTGVNLNGNPNDINENPNTWGYGKAPLHYSGNFWWSKSSHVKKLPNPTTWAPDDNYQKWRVLAEMWLCQLNDSKYNCAWYSNVDHYTKRYTREIYFDKF